MSPDRPSDDRLAEEVGAQLHHLDDRRDAAEMRVEELVRDAEFDDRPHGSASHSTRSMWLIVAAAAVAGGLLYLWLKSQCL